MATVVAGLDEVGRGALAGAVLAAAVILPEDASLLDGLRDSKALTAPGREALAVIIRATALDFAIGRAEPREIDEMNILKASLLAMSRAIRSLRIRPGRILVDGLHLPDSAVPGEAIVGGDALIPSISAAAILAKVRRDQEMSLADALYPGYGFAIHKGYPTKAHRAALEALGPCPLHRRSFRPVKALTMRAP